MHLVILWNKYKYQGVTEKEFSYNYCYSKNKEQLSETKKFTWLDIEPQQTLENLFSEITENQDRINNADYYLFINKPDLLFSRTVIEKMIQLAGRYQLELFAPVYNSSRQEKQNAECKIPYLNYSSYLDVASDFINDFPFVEPLAQIPLSQLDNSVVCFNQKTFHELNHKQTIEQIFTVKKNEHCSHKDLQVSCLNNILMHSFGNYYASKRDDLYQLIPVGIKSMLDVGCARGFFGQHVKQRRPEIHLTGIEKNPIMAAEAAQYYDQILVQDVESLSENEVYEHINCGDVLEHFENPRLVLSHLYKALTFKGTIVASVPNIGHWTVVKDLCEGRFDYLPFGITCITHLRWFTEVSLKQLFEEVGFSVLRVEKQQVTPTLQGQAFIQKLQGMSKTISIDSLYTNELTIVATKI